LRLEADALLRNHRQRLEQDEWSFFLEHVAEEQDAGRAIVSLPRAHVLARVPLRACRVANAVGDHEDAVLGRKAFDVVAQGATQRDDIGAGECEAVEVAPPGRTVDRGRDAAAVQVEDATCAGQPN
jgi:hypothetical protein